MVECYIKLGIMQPYIFPYIGYFSLIFETDKWVVFDDIQYIRHGWVNRNRILHPNPEKGWQFIIVPLEKHSRGTHICDIIISNNNNWKDKIKSQLAHYKKKAPYFNQTMELIEKCFKYEERYLSKHNVSCLKEVCNYLGINFEYEFFSEMNIDKNMMTDPGDWALVISQELHADVYINPVGGTHLFNADKFENKGIELKLLKMNEIQYNQYIDHFIPDLSIIDVIMFNSPEQIKNLLNTHIVVE